MSTTKVAGKRQLNGALDELRNALAVLKKKHGLALEVQTATISKTGIVNVGIKGGAEGSNVKVTPASAGAPVQRQPGQTQAELRFENHHREVGLKKKDLHSRFKLEGKTYELIGLKGRNNKVVLRRINQPGEFTVPVDQFKMAATAV